MVLYGWMMFLSVLPGVKKIQKEFNFDIIDAHYVYPDGFAAVLLGKYFKKPVVVSARGSDVNFYRTFPLICRLLRYVLTKADRVVAVSEALQESMVQLGIPEQKISYIPNGVDTHKFYPSPKEQARRELGIAERQNDPFRWESYSQTKVSISLSDRLELLLISTKIEISS